MEQTFFYIRILLALTCLVTACYSDYKTRTVSNKLWKTFLPLSLTLTCFTILMFDSSKLYSTIISVTTTTVFALILFYTGAFGGADSKALIYIATALPYLPTVNFTIFKNISPIAQSFPAITTLTNAVLITLVSTAYLTMHNLIQCKITHQPLFPDQLKKEPLIKKMLTLITSQKYTITQLQQNKHLYPTEQITLNTTTQTTQRKLLATPNYDNKQQTLNALTEKCNINRIQTVWATPGIPMLIYITAGLIITLTIGDIAWLMLEILA